MKTIKNIGLGFVLIAFGLLITTLFLNQFTLTNQVIENAGMNQDQMEYFTISSKHLIDKKYTSKIGFIKDLNQTFKSTNKHITADFSITEGDIDKLVKLSDSDGHIQYSTDFAETIFNENNSTNAYKIKGIKDYTSWMHDREFSSSTELKEGLSSSINGFNSGIEAERD